MSFVIKDQDTAAALAGAREAGDVWGPDGRFLGQFVPLARMDLPELDEATIAEMERERLDPNAVRYTPEQVMERLREIDRCGQ